MVYGTYYIEMDSEDERGESGAMKFERVNQQRGTTAAAAIRWFGDCV